MSEVERLKQQLDTLVKRLKQTQLEHQKELSVERAKLKSEHTKQTRQLQEQLAMVERQCKQHRNSRKRAEELLSQREYDLGAHIEELLRREKEHGGGDEAMAGLRREVAELQARNRSLEEEKAESASSAASPDQEEVAQLRREVAELQARNRSLEEEKAESFSAASQDQARGEEVAAQLRRDLAELQEAREQEAARLRRDLAELQARHQEAEAAAASQDQARGEEVAQLRRDLAELEARREAAEAQEEVAAQLRRDLAEAQERHEALSKHCQEMEAHLVTPGDSRDLAVLEQQRLQYEAEVGRTFAFMEEAERVACDLKGAVDMLDINLKATSLRSIIDIVKQVSASLIRTFDEFALKEDAPR